MDAGELVGCAIFNEFGNLASCHNFSAGGLVAVPANTLHSAENPNCTPVRAMQALSGGVNIQGSAYPIIAAKPTFVFCSTELGASPCTRSQMCL